MRPKDLAQAVDLSVQSVRNYEESGFIPTAERSAHGYRLYTQRHLQALRVARSMIAGYGWMSACNIMKCVHQSNLPKALALIDAWHADVHRNRCEIDETLRVLRDTSTTLPTLTQMENLPHWRSALRVSEAARIVGVRVSAIRFWEEQGLLQPARENNSHYRLYDAEQMRKLQVIALLRKANYSFEAIRAVLTQLANGAPEQALAAAEKRLKDLAEVSRRCVEATAHFWAYIESVPQRYTTGD